MGSTTLTGAYALLHTPSGKCYVGGSTNIHNRVQQHFSRLKSGRHANTKLSRQWANSYPTEWAVVVLEQCTASQLQEREQYFIDTMDSALNISKCTDGRDIWLGKKHTPETIKKMSVIASGHLVSKETRRKLSVAHTGRVLTTEHKQKIGASGKGRVVSKETRQKLSVIRKGVKLTEEAKQKIGNANRGRTVSSETRHKLSIAGLGRVVAEEVKIKIGNVHRGKVVTEETRQKLSIAARGRVVSLETRQKLSLALKGRKHATCTEETKSKLRVARVWQSYKRPWKNTFATGGVYV